MKRSISTTALLLCTFACNEARQAQQQPQRRTQPPAVAGAGGTAAESGGSAADVLVRPRLERCERGGQTYKLGEWMFDRERCDSCLCQRSGWDCHPAFCNDTPDCDDAGTCAGCELGDRRFPLGEGLLCSDGCNHCTCSGSGRWFATQVLCQPPPEVEPCAQPPDADTTHPVY